MTAWPDTLYEFDWTPAIDAIVTIEAREFLVAAPDEAAARRCSLIHIWLLLGRPVE